jgi:two-component system KDP operon response regulator KdpE
MNEQILIIDDDDMLGTLLLQSLRPKGFIVEAASGGRAGLRKAFEMHPDLVILDVMMPEMDGWETCRRLREMSDIPIIMLTAKSEEQDIILGFQLGVDDYIKKPFSILELTYRIRAVLRRTKDRQQKTPIVYDDGTLRIDLGHRQVEKNGDSVHLTPTEFRLLSYLVQHKGTVMPHKRLLQEVWGPHYEDATDCLSLYIRYLREKLEVDPSDPKYIRTEWGRGYWFAPLE